MRILERYINKSIVLTFISMACFFFLLYILIDITTQLDEFIDRKVPYDVIAQYYLTYFPIIVVQTSPVACLIATLFCFSQMNLSNEIIAMRASGLNFWRITKPALFFGIFISFFIFWLNENYVPQALEATRQIKNENMILLVDKLTQKERIKNLTFYGLNNRLYFISHYYTKTDELEGITIIEHDESQNIREKIVAYKGKWTGIAWKFYNCQITTYGEDGVNAPVKVKFYEEKLMDIEEKPRDFIRQRLNVSSMNIRQLEDYIGKFSNSGAVKAINNLRVDLHQKIAFPFGNFVIILVGLPFALLVQGRRSGTFTSVLIAIAIGFLYFVTNAVMLAFGKGGALPPLLSAWAAPILFTGLALYLIEQYF